MLVLTTVFNYAEENTRRLNMGEHTNPELSRSPEEEHIDIVFGEEIITLTSANTVIRHFEEGATRLDYCVHAEKGDGYFAFTPSEEIMKRLIAIGCKVEVNEKVDNAAIEHTMTGIDQEYVMLVENNSEDPAVSEYVTMQIRSGERVLTISPENTLIRRFTDDEFDYCRHETAEKVRIGFKPTADEVGEMIELGFFATMEGNPDNEAQDFYSRRQAARIDEERDTFGL
jgi:hypothetical protein